MNFEYPFEVVSRKMPKYLVQQDAGLFDNERVKESPVVSAIGKKGLLVFPSGHVLKGFSLEPTQFNIEVGIRGLLKSYLKALCSLLNLHSLKKLETAYYVTNSNSKNFFHWFLDVLQKLEYMEQNYLDAVQKALVIIPLDHRSDFMMSSLSAFDFRFFQQDNNQLVLVKNLMLVPDLAPTGNYRKEVVLNLRQRLRNYFLSEPDESMQVKRVYITRKNAKKRKIINEDDLLPKLKEFGFKVIDMDVLRFNQQVQVMLGAEMLVSLHGAGLTHMLWMNDEGKVLEIRASGDCHNNCYFTLASDLELDYYYSLAEKTDATQSTQQADYIIDPKLFEARLEQMVE